MVTPDKETVENDKNPKKVYYAVLIEGKPGEVFNNDAHALTFLSKQQNGTKTSFIKTRLQKEAVQIVKNHKKHKFNLNFDLNDFKDRVSETFRKWNLYKLYFWIWISLFKCNLFTKEEDTVSDSLKINLYQTYFRNLTSSQNLATTTDQTEINENKNIGAIQPNPIAKVNNFDFSNIEVINISKEIKSDEQNQDISSNAQQFWSTQHAKMEELRSKGMQFIFFTHVVSNFVVIAIDCLFSSDSKRAPSRYFGFKPEGIKRMWDLQSDKDFPAKFEFWLPSFATAIVHPIRKVPFGLNEPKKEGRNDQFEYRMLTFSYHVKGEDDIDKSIQAVTVQVKKYLLQPLFKANYGDAVASVCIRSDLAKKLKNPYHMFYKMINQANFIIKKGRSLNDLYLDKDIALLLQHYSRTKKPDIQQLQQTIVDKFYHDGVFPDEVEDIIRKA